MIEEKEQSPLKEFTEERFGGDEKEAMNFLVEYALKDLGYIGGTRVRKQRNINLGKLHGTRKEFLFEVADKMFRGKYATAIFKLLEIALLYEKEATKKTDLLKAVSLKKDYDLEAINRRMSRKKDTPFIVSYAQEQDELIEAFYNFSTDKGMKTNECFSYLIGTCLSIYKGVLNGTP